MIQVLAPKFFTLLGKHQTRLKAEKKSLLVMISHLLISVVLVWYGRLEPWRDGSLPGDPQGPLGLPIPSTPLPGHALGLVIDQKLLVSCPEGDCLLRGGHSWAPLTSLAVAAARFRQVWSLKIASMQAFFGHFEKNSSRKKTSSKFSKNLSKSLKIKKTQ